MVTVTVQGHAMSFFALFGLMYFCIYLFLYFVFSLEMNRNWKYEYFFLWQETQRQGWSHETVHLLFLYCLEVKCLPFPPISNAVMNKHIYNGQPRLTMSAEMLKICRWDHKQKKSDDMNNRVKYILMCFLNVHSWKYINYFITCHNQFS